MKVDLCELLKQDGFANVQMAVGADVPGVTNKTFMDLFKQLQLEHLHKTLLPLPSPEVLNSLLEPSSKGHNEDSSALDENSSVDSTFNHEGNTSNDQQVDHPPSEDR